MREPIPTKMRFSVLERDEFTCQYCGAKAPDAILHVDHLIPVSKGGATSPENLITSCQPCNMGKSGGDLLFIPDHIMERAGTAYARGVALRGAIVGASGERNIPAVPVDAPQEVVDQIRSEGQALAVSIASASLTQDFVAGAVGRSKGLVSKWVNNVRPIPDRFIGPLCAATGSNLLAQYQSRQAEINGAPEVTRLAQLMRAAA